MTLGPFDFLVSCTRCRRVHPAYRPCRCTQDRACATWRVSLTDASGTVVAVLGDFDQVGMAEAARGRVGAAWHPYVARVDRVA